MHEISMVDGSNITFLSLKAASQNVEKEGVISYRTGILQSNLSMFKYYCFQWDRLKTGHP